MSNKELRMQEQAEDLTTEGTEGGRERAITIMITSTITNAPDGAKKEERR